MDDGSDDNNSTNINKTNNHLSPLTSHLNSLNIQKTTTYRSLGFYVLIVLFLSKWMRFMHIAFICVNYAHHFHER